MWGRSHCPDCGRVIRSHHLVPIISWILLRGYCVDCHKPIHIQYPLVELAAAILMLIAFLRHNFFLAPFALESFLFETLFSFILLFVSIFDLRWKLIPVELLLASTSIFTVWSFLTMHFSLWHLVLGIAIGFFFLGIQVWVSRGKWMGEGDPWIGAFLGAALGWPGIGISLYVTYIVGAVVAFAIFFSGEYRRGFRIPFAPLLSLGGLGALWFGSSILSWLTQTF